MAVAVSYFGAWIVHDELGLSFIPFMVLSLPWSVFLYEATNQTRSHDVAAAAFAIACWLLSGVNALVLCVLVDRGSSHLKPFGRPDNADR